MDITIPTGPWSGKLPTFVTSKRIAVLIHNNEKEIIEHEFIIDYGNYTHRKFLGQLTYWAISNKLSVETLDADEWARIK